MESTEPLVSIVLPTRNGERHLRDAIDSCLNQTYATLELIVVDDGSTDATSDILRDYADPRLRILRRTRDHGLPEALNTGFAASHGQYLTWTSDDNLYEPQALELMVNYLHLHPDVGLVYSDYWLIGENNEIIDKIIAEDPSALVRRDCVGACFLYRRSVYEAVGEYNPAARLAEDYEYWLRIAQCFAIAPLNTPLYRYRCRSGSLTGRIGWFAAARAGETALLRLGWINRAEHRRRLAFIDVCEAFEAHQLGEPSLVRQRALRGILYNPAHLGNRGLISILIRASVGSRTNRAIRLTTQHLLRRQHV